MPMWVGMIQLFMSLLALGLSIRLFVITRPERKEAAAERKRRRRWVE